MAKKKPRTEAEKRRAHRTESYRAVIVAVAAAIVLRIFVLQLFKIPSKSMEPTLLGDPAHGDRVIAVKPWKRVQRWGIYVFKHYVRHEGREVDYIKRFVGMPGDVVLIRGGDFHAGGDLEGGAAIERKPGAVQEDAWVRVYDGATVRNGRLFGKYWRERTPGAWRYDGEAAAGPTLRTDARASAEGARIEHRQPVTDQYIRAGHYPLVCPGCRGRVNAWLDTAHPFVRCDACGEVFDAREPIGADGAVAARDPLGRADGQPIYRFTCAYLDCRHTFRVHKHDLTRDATGAAQAACPACARTFPITGGALHRRRKRLHARLGGVPLVASLLEPPKVPWRETVLIPGTGNAKRAEPVGDLRLSFEFVFEEGGTLAAELARHVKGEPAPQVFRLEMPLTEAASAVRLTGPAARRGERRLDLTAQRTFVGGGGTHSLSFAYVDGALLAEIDGEVLFEHVFSQVGAPVEAASAAVEARCARVSIRRLALDRDLHYRAEVSADCAWLREETDRFGGTYLVGRLMEDEYMPLGDDSPRSSDARYWHKPVRAGKIVGRAVLLVWPLNRFRVLH